MFEVTLFDAEGLEIGTLDMDLPAVGDVLEFGETVLAVDADHGNRTASVTVEY